MAKYPRNTTAKNLKSKTGTRKRSVIKSLLGNRLVRKALVILVAVLVGVSGAWAVYNSRAATTDLGPVQCNLRGRVYLSDQGLCTDTCVPNAGVYKTDTTYGYCANAVSRTVGETQCHNMNRRYVTGVGCSRRWQQTNDAPASLQCLETTYYYIVSSTIDYCTDFKVDPPDVSSSTNWVWPTTNHRVSFEYGLWYGSKGRHKGIDLPAEGNGTSVYAAHSGKVMSAKYNSCGGEYVISVDGISGLYHGYQHMKNLKFSQGAHVDKGAYIGQIGPTNGCVTGPHLHFSIELRPQVSVYAEDNKDLIYSNPPRNYLP